MFKWTPQQKCSRGRPKKRKKDCLEEDMKKLGKLGKLTTRKRLTKTRNEWRKIEEEAKTHQGLPQVPQEVRNPSMKRRSLYTSLIFSIQVMDDIAPSTYNDHHDFLRSLGHNFSVTQLSGSDHGEGGTLVAVVKTWLKSHEEAQVMLASILVVVGLWWLVRTVLTLLINLICPLLVVLLAVVCVPQLRAPLLGQNYPLLANLLRSILMKMAENIKTQ